MDVKDWRNVILNKILSIYKTNLIPGEKWKVGTAKLIFHVFPKYLVIFWRSTLEKSWTLKPILKNKSEHFEYRSCFFAPWHQRKECALIIIASTVDYFVSTIQKFSASSRYLQQMMLRTYPWPHQIFWFFEILRRFLTYLMTLLVGP